VVVHGATALPLCDVATVSGIPTTSVSRTLADLAGAIAPALFEKALDDALRRELTSVARLSWRLNELGGRGRPGSRTLRALLKERDVRGAKSESALEERLIRLGEQARLPPPVRQFTIRERGRAIARVDLAYPEAKLAIEADGYRWHSGRAAWQRDIGRLNRIVNCGWRLLSYSHADVTSRRRCGRRWTFRWSKIIGFRGSSTDEAARRPRQAEESSSTRAATTWDTPSLPIVTP
jgi:very-short-patch-repair endonuclease